MPDEIICIICPNGCHLNAASTSNGAVITGNLCPRGEKYGRQEATAPSRVVTGVVRTLSSECPCVPFKTSQAVPKEMIPGMFKHLYSLKAALPVRRGEKLVQNYKGTGIDIVYTRTVPPQTMEKQK